MQHDHLVSFDRQENSVRMGLSAVKELSDLEREAAALGSKRAAAREFRERVDRFAFETSANRRRRLHA
jgi:hypothetical protein